MAEDCVDHVLKTKGIKAKACDTYDIRLIGAQGDAAEAKKAISHLPEDVQAHLWQAYGDKAPQVLACGSSERMVNNEPYIEAELNWIIQYEGACTVGDVLNRRLRVAMLDSSVAEVIGSRVEQLLKQDVRAA